MRKVINIASYVQSGRVKYRPLFFVRPRACFHCVVFRVPKNGTLETKKPPAMQVSQHCFSLQ